MRIHVLMSPSPAVFGLYDVSLFRAISLTRARAHALTFALALALALTLALALALALALPIDLSYPDPPPCTIVACLALSAPNLRIYARGAGREVAQEAQRELPSEDAARGSAGLVVPVYKSGEYGDVGGGRGGGGGGVLEEEEEAEVMEWWRGRALLRLALFADEGHPSLAPHTHTTAASSSTPADSSSGPASASSSFTPSFDAQMRNRCADFEETEAEEVDRQRRTCVRNVHVSSFLGVECADCTSRGPCAAFARLSQGPVRVTLSL